MGDYHTHLHPHGPYLGHGPEPGQFPIDHIEKYVETALSKGVEEVCFTEHLYRCVESTSILGNFWEGPNPEMTRFSAEFVATDRTMSIEPYVAAVTTAKDRGLPVLLGFEVDYFPGTTDAVADLLEPYPWDVLIGAPHWLGQWLFDDPDFSSEFCERGVRSVYEDYFAMVVDLLESDVVDVLAHADRIKKLGVLLEERPVDLYQSVVAAAVNSNTAVELNTSGLADPVGEIYPAPTLLQMLHDSEVPITLASDAHRPSQVGRDFDKAIALARSVGYEERLEFRGRLGRRVPL